MLFLFLFSWCMFQPFCFYVGFVLGILLFFICVFAFVLLLVLLSVYEKTVFPAIMVFFWVMLLKRVVCFVCFMFLLFVFLVLFVSIYRIICNILFLCCCCGHKTKWSSCLHLVVLLPFLFFFCCFVLNLFFVFHSSQKRPPKKPDTAKNPKCKNAEKNGQKNQLAQLCSQIVFFIFWGAKLTKLLSWKSVQGCVENPSKHVAQHNWTDFQRKNCFFCFLFVFYFFWKISFSLRKEEEFWKKTKTEKIRKFLDGCSTQKRAIFGRIFNSTAYIYIYNAQILYKCCGWRTQKYLCGSVFVECLIPQAFVLSRTPTLDLLLFNYFCLTNSIQISIYYITGFV